MGGLVDETWMVEWTKREMRSIGGLVDGSRMVGWTEMKNNQALTDDVSENLRVFEGY